VKNYPKFADLKNQLQMKISKSDLELYKEFLPEKKTK